VRPGHVIVEDGRIAAVEEDPSASGAWADVTIAPGFIDMHVHGWGGHDAMGGLMRWTAWHAPWHAAA